VLGAAFIAGRAVMPAIKASRNGRLIALASRSPERAQELISPYEGARVWHTYEALLQDQEVDAVYIPLVNSLHMEWTLRALDAGKHVLCEKPLAMNAAEAEAMAAAAQAAGKQVMEAFMYRFHPAMRAFVNDLQAPTHVEASFGFTLKDPANYRMQSSLGGGALLDVGCYVVSVARWILGEPTDVLARARIADGVDMSVSALLQFEEGKTASLWASFESAEEQELTVITPDRVHRRERPFTSGHDPDDPYQLMVESFADGVLQGRPLAIPISDSIANMRVLDRIRDAAAS
jgi:D-xylose 1-dehydrogenase (NADP+, D-xylono-1,5-lactone-forming)